MNYVMVDISGKVPNYDVALCEAIFRNISENDRLVLIAVDIEPNKVKCPSRKLLSLVPKALQNSRNKVKRGVKAFESFVNYLYLIVYLLFHHVDVLHLQWLPFLEFSSVEKIFLRLIRYVSSKTKIILTVHNLYPHNYNDKQKFSYKRRFDGIKNFLDTFIVHLECSKVEFCKQFNVDPIKVKVVHHGIFIPKNVEIVPHIRGEKLNLIMYGLQSYYKGTDIFVDALNLLSHDAKQKVHASIVGKIEKKYYHQLKEKSKAIDVEWVSEYVTDDVLYKKILESDIIIIPYREISQSGVLLLALSFKRIIVVSDLPSFKETLEGFRDDMFFEKGNARSLAKLVEKYINNEVDVGMQLNAIECLLKEYSWENVACHLIKEVYRENCNICK